MKILCIDATSSFLDFALRAEAQGHEVRVFMGPLKDGSRSPIGNGLIHRVEDYTGSLKWADLILTSDNCKYMRELEPLRRRGFPLWGPNVQCTSWELDRAIGQGVLESVGIQCLPSIPFRDYDTAAAYQLNHKSQRFVCKPCADVDKALSYVSKSHKDMLFMLDHWKRTQPKCVPFIFQEFTPGVEVAVGGWVGRDGFLSQFLENFEFKKLMPGEVGVNTGEMGTAMRYVTAAESKLARELLLPLEPELIRQGYTGYIDVAVIVDKQGHPWPLEFTSRPGWPLFQIQQSLHPDIAQWMRDAIDGQDTFRPYPDIALGVVVAIPDFPYSKLPRAATSGFPVWGITDRNRYNIHPCEMKLGQAMGDHGVEPMMVSAGDYLLVVTGTGKDVTTARTRAYATLKELEVPNSPIYRIDIGCRLEEQLPLLQRHGYATAWQWDAAAAAAGD